MSIINIGVRKSKVVPRQSRGPGLQGSAQSRHRQPTDKIIKFEEEKSLPTGQSVKDSKAQQAQYTKDNMLFVDDETLEGGIKIFDLISIKKKRQKDERKKQKQGLKYKATPYMHAMTEKDKAKYRMEEGDSFTIEGHEIKLDNHVGMYKPTAPAFGVPLMRFTETPVEKMNNRLGKFESYEAYQEALAEVRHYEQDLFNINIQKAFFQRKAMRGQIYEFHRQQKAHKLIEKSFTFGTKLQRNPMSQEEKAALLEEDRKEVQRFKMYERAYWLKKKKANSIAGFVVGDKNQFMLDWDETMAAKQKKELDRKRQARSRGLGQPSDRASFRGEPSGTIQSRNSINKSKKTTPKHYDRMCSKRFDSEDHEIVNPADKFAEDFVAQISSLQNSRPETQVQLSSNRNLLSPAQSVRRVVDLDPDFEKKGYGMLNPFKKLLRKCDEEVNIKLVRQRSHPNFTYHLPLPKNFLRREVLPPEQLRALKETASRIRAKKQLLQNLANEKKFICDQMLELIIKKAADDLFNTPVVSQIPTDSFAEDYQPDDIMKVEQDLNLLSIDQIGSDKDEKVKKKGKKKGKGKKQKSRENSRASRNSKLRSSTNSKQSKRQKLSGKTDSGNGSSHENILLDQTGSALKQTSNRGDKTDLISAGSQSIQMQSLTHKGNNLNMSSTQSMFGGHHQQNKDLLQQLSHDQSMRKETEMEEKASFHSLDFISTFRKQRKALQTVNFKGEEGGVGVGDQWTDIFVLRQTARQNTWKIMQEEQAKEMKVQEDQRRQFHFHHPMILDSPKKSLISHGSMRSTAARSGRKLRTTRPSVNTMFPRSKQQSEKYESYLVEQHESNVQSRFSKKLYKTIQQSRETQKLYQRESSNLHKLICEDNTAFTDGAQYKSLLRRKLMNC